MSGTVGEFDWIGLDCERVRIWGGLGALHVRQNAAFILSRGGKD